MKSKKFKSLTSLRLTTLVILICFMVELFGGNVVYASELFTGDNTYKQSNENQNNEIISESEVVSSENDSNYIELGNLSSNKDVISNVKQDNENEITISVPEEKEEVINSNENIVQDKEIIQEEIIEDKEGREDNFDKDVTDSEELVNEHSDTDVSDDEDEDIVKNFDIFDVAIVGLLDKGSNDVSYGNILSVKNRIPEGSGIWIVPENRESVLKIINITSSKQYYIDQNGFLKQSENINEAGSKLYSEIIDKLIASDKVLIIGRSNGWNEYDIKQEKIVQKTFTNENAGVTIGGKFTDQLVIISENKDESKLGLVLAHELIHGLRGQEGYKDRIEEERYALNLENQIRSELNEELRDTSVIEDAYENLNGDYKDDYKETPLNATSNYFATISLTDTSSSLNLRSGPSTSDTIIGSIPHGVCVSVISKSGDWYKINFLGTFGYVRGDFLSFGNSSSSVTSGTVKLQDTTSSVNVRSGSSTSTSIVGSLSHGTVVKILGSENGWYKISYNNITGYVRADYITPGLSSGSSSTGTGTIKLTDTSSSVNVRSGSGTNYSVVGSLNHGAVVQILGSENGWYRISCNGITGYIRADFITLGGSLSIGSGTGTVKLSDSSSSLNVRSGASTSTSVIGTIYHGTVVQILGSESGWYKINAGGITGFVRGDFIVLGGTTASGGMGTIKLQDTSSSVNIRSGASTNHSVLGSLYHGNIVQILGSESGWYRISCNDITGYVRADFIVIGDSSSYTGVGTIKLQDASSSVNLRKGSSISTSVITSLYHGTVVQILGSENGWYRVSYNGLTGYIRADFISLGGNSFVGSDSPYYSATLKENYIRYFSQDDPAYGHMMYSNHGDITQTIAASACGPTAYSIVVSTLNRIDVPPTEMCRYALAKGFRTYNNGTSSNLFATAASDYSNPKYNLNRSYVSGVSAAKSLLADGKHLVIASMSSGHVTRQGHYIVLSGTTVINGKIYFKVYDPHRWNEYYIYDNELIDTVKEDGFILLSETAVRNEANGFWGFSNKNNSVIDTNINASNGSTGESIIKPTPGGSTSNSGSIVPKSDVSYITLDVSKYSKDVQEKINKCLEGIEASQDDEFWLDYYMEELEHIIEYADANGKTNISIKDRLVGVVSGALQAVGGFTEAGAGAAIFAGASWTGIGIPIGVAGGYMAVDGAGNFIGGITKVFNSLFGNNTNDTGNFMKNGYKLISPEYGEDFYNLTQLGIGVYSVGSGLMQLPKSSVRFFPRARNIARAKTEGLVTKTVVADVGKQVLVTTKTDSGMILQKTVIEKSKVTNGLLYIGVDAYATQGAYGSLGDK